MLFLFVGQSSGCGRVLGNFKILLFLEKERGEGREKGMERNINVWFPLECPLLGTWPTTQACALTGNQTGDPLFHRLVLNPLSLTSQCKIDILDNLMGLIQSVEAFKASLKEKKKLPVDTNFSLCLRVRACPPNSLPFKHQTFLANLHNCICQFLAKKIS